jgi:hypothetical protein
MNLKNFLNENFRFLYGSPQLRLFLQFLSLSRFATFEKNDSRMLWFVLSALKA